MWPIRPKNSKSEEDDGYDGSTDQPAARRPQQPRVSARERETDDGRDAEYDLLTAALIGATIGAGLTFLLGAVRPGGVR